MKKDTALQDELKDLSPFLYEQKLKQEAQGDGFHMPPDYFDALEEAVLARLDSHGVRRPPAGIEKPGLVRWLFTPQILLATAAAIVLVLAAVWFFRPAEPVPVIAELTEEDIEAYVLDNIHDFDTEQLAALTSYEPSDNANEDPSASPKSKTDKPTLDDLSPEDVESVLRDMSEEELQELL